MIERTSEPAPTDWDHDGDPSQETIALLQDEIARLESELRARDEAASPTSAVENEYDAADRDAARRRAEELAAELRARDETIEILLEQSRLFEEAAAAQRAEWEQLNEWVAEVERRVDGRDGDDARLRSELQAERGQLQSLRRSADSDRIAWEAQRAGLEREGRQLREQLARSSQGPAAVDDGTAFIALASENRKLRAARDGLERVAAEAGELRRKLDLALGELEQSRREVQQISDERDRERNEHEAERGALRSQLARESLQRAVEPGDPRPAGAVEGAGRNPALEADERIRALRQHLMDVHEHEAARRAEKTLSARLSRLWRHTGPG